MCDGFDQDARPQHELIIHTKEFNLLRELIPQGAHDGDARLVCMPAKIQEGRGI
jgi:hypothetical protein